MTHPNAKPALRARARELRRQGLTYTEIQAELNCSKGSISLWVSDLPRPATAYSEVGALTPRELMAAGTALYWAEGTKDKPYARREDVLFVNSDPGVIRVFLSWLRLLEVAPERLRYRLMIHETADTEGVKRYWADFVGVSPDAFQRTTIKKHNPRTVRKNTGEDYRGCLVIRVLKGAELYRRIDGWWAGIVAAAEEGSGKV